MLTSPVLVARRRRQRRALSSLARVAAAAVVIGVTFVTPSSTGAAEAATAPSPAPGNTTAPPFAYAIEDSQVGSTTHRIEYTGTWKTCLCGAGSANGSYRYSYAPGDKATIRFYGQQLRLRAVREPTGGIASISVDGSAPVPVDLYSPTQGSAVVYSSPVLPVGAHQVTVTVTGKKNASATRAVIPIDRADIYSSAPSPPAGPAGNWRLAFGDEFNGTTLDTTKWTYCHMAMRPGCQGSNPDEWQLYRPANVTVANGSLRLTAKREQVYSPEAGRNYNFTSGVVSTGLPQAGGPASFSFLYGYFEARVKVARGAGLWSAVWLNPVSLNWPPEIDVVEQLGREPTMARNNIHYMTPTGRQQSHVAFPGPVWADGFHTFGMDWQPTHVTFYIDGKAVRTVTEPAAIPREAMAIDMNLSVGGWAGPVAESTVLPRTMEVEWVRVWTQG